MKQFQLKLELWINIVWGIVILFLLTGALTGHKEKAAAGLLIVVAVWTMMEITQRALASLKLLKFINDGSYDLLIDDMSKALESKKNVKSIELDDEERKK